MALSPQDKAYYQEKLGWKGFIQMFVWAVLIGGVCMPLLVYFQDEGTEASAKWTTGDTLVTSMHGIMLGMIVSVIMYLLLRVFLAQEWLPKRR